MPKKTPNPTDVFVGNRVRTARIIAKMSQEKLGDALGITFQQIQKYEKGANRIGASRLQQIADALGKPTSWFFDEQPGGKGKTEGADIIGQMLTTPGGLKLATSFVAIKGNAGRHAVAEVAHALAAQG